MLQRIMWKERLGDVVVAIVLGLVFVLTACGGGDGGQGEVEATIAERSPVGPGVVVAPAPPVLADVDSGTARPVVTGPVSFEDAEAAFRDRRYDEAVERFTLYTEDRPTNPWGHYMLGLSAWKAGEHQQAEEAFERALERNPEHVKSLINLSRVLLETERPEEAIGRIQQAILVDGESSVALRLLGRARHQLGLVEEAIDAYWEAIVLDDEDVWSMNNLGFVLIEEGRFDEALPPLARATELRRDVAMFQNNLGIALERTGHYTTAADAYRSALQADSTHERATVNLARVESLEDDPGRDPVDLGALALEFIDEVARVRQPVRAAIPETSFPQDSTERPDEESTEPYEVPRP